MCHSKMGDSAGFSHLKTLPIALIGTTLILALNSKGSTFDLQCKNDCKYSQTLDSLLKNIPQGGPQWGSP